MPERDILRAILLHFGSRRDILLWRNNTGYARELKVRFGLPGSADIFLIRAGHFYAVEVKSATGQQSEQQRRFQAAVERVGATYVLARSVGDVARAIDQR